MNQVDKRKFLFSTCINPYLQLSIELLKPFEEEEDEKKQKTQMIVSNPLLILNHANKPFFTSPPRK